MATYAMPTLAQRRAEPSARVAYYANIVRNYEATFAGVPFEERAWHVIAMCTACGANTGNWCDTCEAQGRTFTAHWGQLMVGSPLCSTCEDLDEVACLLCGIQNRCAGSLRSEDDQKKPSAGAHGVPPEGFCPRAQRA